MIHSEYKYVSRIRLSPLKSVRLYCKTVCGGSSKEVRLCTTADCPLYAYRMGKNPSRSGVGGCQRSHNGRFLPLSAGEISTIASKEGQSMGKAVLAHHGSTMREFEGAQIEVTKGEVRIEKTGNELVIRLTQEAHLH